MNKYKDRRKVNKDYIPASKDNNWDDMSNIKKPTNIDLIICGRKLKFKIYYDYYGGHDDEKRYMLKNVYKIIKNKEKYQTNVSKAVNSHVEKWLREEDQGEYGFPDKVDDIMKYIKPKYIYICGKRPNSKYKKFTSAVIFDHDIGDRGISICMNNMSFTDISTESSVL